MKTIVIGASGLVGQNLLREFSALGETLGTCHSQIQSELTPLDLADPAQIEKIIGEFRPDVVLLPAAMTNVDLCEEKPELSRQINVDGTAAVARAARKLDARLVYISTDYVFDGTAGPYGEDATPNPINHYSRHKLEAENVVRETVPHHLILRTSSVYGWERLGKNFVLQLLRRFRAGEKPRVFSDQYGSPTYAPNLAEVIRELVERRATGLFHAGGMSWVNRVELAMEVARGFGIINAALDIVTSAQVVQKARRPLRGGLRMEKMHGVIRGRMLTLPEGLARMKREESE